MARAPSWKGAPLIYLVNPEIVPGTAAPIVTTSIICLGSHRDFPIADAGSEAAWTRSTAASLPSFLILVITWVAFFSLFATKLSSYVWKAYPSLFVLLAAHFPKSGFCPDDSRSARCNDFIGDVVPLGTGTDDICWVDRPTVWSLISLPWRWWAYLSCRRLDRHGAG